MEAEGESLAEAFAGAIIELARGGPAGDVGQGVPGHRAAAALAHGHTSQRVPARDGHGNAGKHDLSARDLSALHPPVAPFRTRGKNHALMSLLPSQGLERYPSLISSSLSQKKAQELTKSGERSWPSPNPFPSSTGWFFD